MRIQSVAVTAVCGVVLGFGALIGCENQGATPQAKFTSVQPAAAQAKTPAAPTTRAVSFEWFELFDGKTLSNWKVADFAGGGEPKAKDGAIAIPLPAGGDMTGLAWDGIPLPKADYEISLQAKRVDGSDFFCALTFPVNNTFASLVLGGWGGSVCGISSIDFEDASRNDTTTTHDFKNNTWYNVRMRVMKGRLQAWLDGERIVNVSIKERKVDVRIECESCKPLGVATWNTASAIRDLRIRLLKPEELEAAADEEKQENP